MKKLIIFSILLLSFLLIVPSIMADTLLLPYPGWHLTGSNGDAQEYHDISSNALIGMTTMTITYDLHGNTFLGGDASAIIIDQNGWHFISLSNYGQNGKNGVQTVTIPLSAFGLNLASPVGTLHTRFWHSGSWTVDITSISVSNGTSVTPTPTIVPTQTPTSTPTLSPTSIPTPTPTVIVSNPNKPDHTVLIVEENRKLQDVLRTGYFTTLANAGALMVNSKALTHPSQPNYYALFSGSTQGITDSSCPSPGAPYSTENIGHQLVTHSMSFIGYAENLGTISDCSNNNGYDSGHVPWVRFSNLTSANSRDFTQFPTDYTQLPTLSMITPNLIHDAHDGDPQSASDWLQMNIDPYRVWAMTHNSLLIITFDEDDESGDNTIYTVFVGPMVKPGIYNQAITHYNVLSTIEELYGLSHLNAAPAITSIFK